jgi:hypothetical protein
MQGLSVIPTLIMAAVSHRKHASTNTSHDCCGVEDSHKRNVLCVDVHVHIYMDCNFKNRVQKMVDVCRFLNILMVLSLEHNVQSFLWGMVSLGMPLVWVWFLIRSVCTFFCAQISAFACMKDRTSVMWTMTFPTLSCRTHLWPSSL